MALADMVWSSLVVLILILRAVSRSMQTILARTTNNVIIYRDRIVRWGRQFIAM